MKKNYRPHSWSHYNKSLVNRGSLTLWIAEDLIKNWLFSGRAKKRGRPYQYSDEAILCANQIRFIYHLPLRATQGFLRSIFRLLNLSTQIVPCYSTLSRRLKQLSMPLPKRLTTAPRDLVLDSTGLKVYGEGEWKVRQHGVTKRRTWRKLHIGFDANSQEIVCAVLTTNDFKDNEILKDCLSQLSPGEIGQIALDGAYDAKSSYEYCQEQKIKPLIPPAKNAKIWHSRKMHCHPRDEALRWIRKQGRRHWRLNSGYSIRSLAETGMFRFKTTFSDKLSSRVFDNQANEAFIKCGILNIFTYFGLPNSKAA